MASIQIVKDIKPIVGADKILKATVLGWDTVIKVNEFNEGDLCVWHEPDTIVDATNPVYEIIKKHKYRLKISKIRGQISQGLALPVHHFKAQLEGLHLKVGLDVTDQVKILHYTKPTNTQGDICHGWPHFIRKTDQPNLRSNPKALDELKKQKSVIFSMKMDGTSATYFYHDSTFGLCSRNYRLERSSEDLPLSYYQVVAAKYALQKRLAAYGKDIAIQGEICGPGINSNPANYKEIQFFVFHAWDCQNQRYLSFDEMIQIVKDLNALDIGEAVPALQHVPIIFRGNLPSEKTIADLVAQANALTYAPGKLAEGMVICGEEEVYSEALDNRLSVKVLSELFELKHG
eukprot:TRINITY_DN5268_c0_g1_i1.p1 TRINITY_DN5268_c0_g1~~TRINITY_DN5268_c0_g1_i1.p1  ORF type:complete len:384 (+),score=75.41 TRINITY_DN5268_c0_g1_i1:115-1152(+)